MALTAQGGFALSHYSREGLQDELTHLIARYVGVDPANIVLTAGADDGIRHVMDCMDVSQCLISSPTYGGYRVAAAASSLSVKLITGPEDVSGVAAAWNALANIRADGGLERTAVVICSPNNPTGVVVDMAAIRKLADEYHHCTFVVDHVYADFIGSVYTAEDVQLDNVVYIRSFSKAFGLASVRLGYLVASADNASVLQHSYSSINVSGVALQAGLAIMRHLDYYRVHAMRVRKLCMVVLRSLQCVYDVDGLSSKVEWTGGSANFVCGTGTDWTPLIAASSAAGYAIRYLPDYNACRITIGEVSDSMALVDIAQRQVAQRLISSPRPRGAGCCPVVCLSTLEREDRLIQVSRELADMLPTWFWHEIHTVRLPIDPRRGQYGPWIAHMQAMIYILSTGADYGLVFEDDVVMDRLTFSWGLRTALNFIHTREDDHWDIVRLGAMVYSYDLPTEVPGIWRASSDYAHAMFYSRRCILRCLADQGFTPSCHVFGVDDYFRFCNTFDDFTLTPSVCYQRESATDNPWFVWDPLSIQRLIQSPKVNRWNNSWAWYLRKLPAVVQRCINPIRLAIDMGHVFTWLLTFRRFFQRSK